VKVCVSAIYQDKLLNIATPQELSRKLRRADDFIRLAAVAAFKTTHPLRTQMDEISDKCGIVLGTAFGTMQTNFEVLDQIISEQPTSPTLFSHSVFNAAVGYLASIFGMRGCALTVTDFSFPFFKALQQGYLALLSGNIDYCLVLQVETYSDVLQDARKKRGFVFNEWQPGVVCWLLEKTTTSTSGKIIFENIKITDQIFDPLLYLEFEETVEWNNQVTPVNDPLGAAMVIGESVLQANGQDTVDYHVKGLCGEVALRIRQ
jgi:hypothetical protein